MSEPVSVMNADLNRQGRPMRPVGGDIVLVAGQEGPGLDRFRKLIHLSQQILAETTADGLLTSMARAARELAGARLAMAGYGYRDGSFRVGATSRADEVMSSLPSDLLAVEGRAAFEKMRMAGAPFRLSRAEMAQDPAWPDRASMQQGLLVVPLVTRDRQVCGMLAVCDREEGEFTDEDAELLAELGTLGALALQHVEAQIEAQEQVNKLNATFAALPTALVLYDGEGQIDRLNPAAERMLGYTAGDTHRPIEKDESIDRSPTLVETHGARALDGEQVSGEVVTFSAPSGASITGQANGAPKSLTASVSASPIPGGAVVSLTDISELMNLQERLQQANEELEVQAEEMRAQNEELAQIASDLEIERARLEAVLDQMPGGVIIAEAPSGRIVLANRQVQELLRGPYRPAASPVDYMQYQAFYPDGRPYLPEQAALVRSLQTGEVVTNEEMQVIRGDGQRAVVLVSSKPVRDRKGRIVAGVVTFFDITQRKEMEAELQAALEAVRQARDELEMRVEERTADLRRANQALEYQAYLLANVHDAIVATDASYRITAWNRAAEELYGWRGNEALGQVFDQLVPSTAAVEDINNLSETLYRTGRLQVELMQRRRDGTSIIVDVRVMALADPDGAVGGYIAAARDISQRKQAEAERESMVDQLRTSEEMLRQLAENVNEVFWITDADRGQLLYVNPAYEAVWGRSRESLRADPASLLEAVHPADQDRAAAARRAAAEGPSDGVYRIMRDDGSLRWVRVRAAPIRNAAGELYRIAGLAEDVTDEVVNYQRLERGVAERTRELSTLLTVSHHMASVLQVGPLLELILDQLENIIEYTGAAIYRLDGDEVTVLAYRGSRPEGEVLNLSFPIKDTVGLEEVLARGEPVVIPDTHADERLAHAWRESPHQIQKQLLGDARSWMAVPLRVKERVIGLLRVDHQEPNRFTIPKADLALAFADHAAVAMENARLYEQVEALAAAEERQRLARDLHDAVSQTLFSASLIADVLPRVWDNDQRQGEQSLRELQQLTRGAMAEMRTLLLELRPTSLTQVEIGVLLRHLTEAAASQAGIPIHLQAPAHCPIPGEVQVALYRIAQEALNNVVKHAEAQSASVTLSCEEEPGSGTVLELTIADDGCGFQMERAGGESFGLSIMNERAEGIGATLAVTSAPGQGARITVTWKQP